ncbi:MAG: YggT family protein [Candidatus Latescibacterota bacterium]|nr:MAG: YggT family protein [Candidatus Latescibacterota bacterium]
MFDTRHFVNGLIGMFTGLLNLYMWIVVVRVLVSWFHVNPYNPFVQFLYRLTDPALNPIRRRLPRVLWTTGLDFSPLILILCILIVRLFLESLRL